MKGEGEMVTPSEVRLPSEKFLRLIPYVIRNEGDRFTNHKADKGGATKWGITWRTLDDYQRTYKHLLGRTVADLTYEDALQIYYEMYWRFEEVTRDEVALKCFDIYVNLPPQNAIIVIQRALVACYFDIKVDGKLGPQTISALNCVPAVLFLGQQPGALISSLVTYYGRVVQRDCEKANHDPSQAENIVGWLARALRLPGNGETITKVQPKG